MTTNIPSTTTESTSGEEGLVWLASPGYRPSPKESHSANLTHLVVPYSVKGREKYMHVILLACFSSYTVQAPLLENGAAHSGLQLTIKTIPHRQT